MPQGSSASPGWFVKDINEVIKGLEQVAAYCDKMIFDSDRTAHVKTMRALFERLRNPVSYTHLTLPTIYSV